MLVTWQSRLFKMYVNVQHSFFCLMKRADNLFDQITDLENLKSAYLKTLKGKRYTPVAIIYGNRLDGNLYDLKTQLEKEICKALNDFVVDELQLTFKQPVINKCVNGIPFLGFLIKRNSISILSKNWKRKLRRTSEIKKKYTHKNEFEFYNRYNSLFAMYLNQKS